MRWSFSACKVAQRDTSRPLKASIQLQTHCDCWEDLTRAEMTVDKNTFRLTLSHAYMFVRCTTHMDMHEMHGTAHPARYHYSRALRPGSHGSYVLSGASSLDSYLSCLIPT